LPKSQRFAGLVREAVGLIGTADRDAPFIVYSRKSWGGSLCWRGVQQVNETPQILCELDALETIAIMVQGGSGVAVVPNWTGLAQRFPDMGFKRIGNDVREIGLLCRTHQADHPVRALIRDAIV
jgi:DNA-binding transcriptional LysR family regulator